MKLKLHDLGNGVVTLEIQPEPTRPITFVNMHISDLQDMSFRLDSEIKSYCKKNDEEDYCCGDVCDFR